MTAGPSTILGALTLTASEKTNGYSANATQGGPDNNGMLQAAIADLNAAAAKLTIVNANMPAGSNKTAISGQLTLLTATS